MDFGKAFLVVGITLAIVVLFNVLLYLWAVRRRQGPGEFHLISKAAKRVRNPWQDEDDDLAELSRRVGPLRERSGSVADLPSPSNEEQTDE